MKFFCRLQSKVMLAIFCTSFFSGTVLLVFMYTYFRSEMRQEFEDRYLTLNRYIGQTIVQMERNAEAVMLNAALYVRTIDQKQGLLSRDRLEELAKQTGVTHLFVVGKDGKFIRSTNEAPELIPNLYSFCNEYKKMFSADSGMNLESTPIIPPFPEAKPYKFLTIPNFDRSRLIHVGLQVNFIAQTLNEILKADANVMRIDLFSPNGTSLGSFGKNAGDFESKPDENVATATVGMIPAGDGFQVNTWIPSAHEICCQCTTAGNLRNGKYSYLVRATVAGAYFAAQLKSLLSLFVCLEALCLGLSLILARFLASRVANQLNRLTNQIKSRVPLVEHATISGLEVRGGGEVRELGDTFNLLLKKLRDSQVRILAGEREKSLQQLASQVAHDIRSPLSFISVFASRHASLPGIENLRAATDRLNGIANDLLKQTRTSMVAEPIIKRSTVSPELLLRQLAAEFEDSVAGLNFAFEGGSVPVRANESNLRRVFSNIIQNAVDAMKERPGKDVGVRFFAQEKSLRIEISDSGTGMDAEILRQIQLRPGVTTKENGTGLGVFGSIRMIRDMGGDFEITSVAPDGGTTIRLTLERAALT